MELFNYYNLDECLDIKSIKNKLRQLRDEFKIEFEIDGDILSITDLDLDEEELNDLMKIFDDNDIIPYLDKDDDDFNGDDFGYDDFSDEEVDY
jgi:hypothetical protein